MVCHLLKLVEMDVCAIKLGIHISQIVKIERNTKLGNWKRKDRKELWFFFSMKKIF